MIKRRMIQGLLILALLCGAVLLAHPSTAWAMEGRGTQEAPYQISTAADLQEFASLVNNGQTTANAELTADIVLNTGLDQTKFAVNDNGVLTYNGSSDFSFDQWTPIGNDYGYRYTGTFDGKGHTIRGLYIDSDAGCAGLFGYIDFGGTVKNLALANSYIRISHSDINTIRLFFVGGICGYNNGGTITSCSNSGTVSGGSTIGTACVGGICGRNDGSIENCSNSGTVSGSITNGIAYVGGICGDNWGSITSCSNSGTVSGSSTNDIAYVGGICGRNANGSLITTCSNSGDVTGSGKGFVGGICGENYGSITNCGNSGPVTGIVAGGICGANIGGSITSCSNSGKNFVGGICGWNYEGTITNCSNSGDVTGSYAGGICGDNDGGTITNCYWLDSTAGAGIGNDSGGATQKSEDEYKSGEVAWLLNQWSGDGVLNGKVWAMGENGYPVLNGKSDNIVVKLTFDANTGNTEDHSIYYANAGAVLPSVKEPVRTGYTFAGWNTKADGSGAPAPATTPDADITFYAQWEKAAYTVMLNTNGGTIADGKGVTNYTYGTATALPTAQDITRAGYIFAGWYNNEALEGDAVTAIPADATGDKEYWAKWTAKSYPSTPSVIPPTVSEETTDAIQDAQPGETVTVDLSSGDTTLDKDVFETLAGKDVTLVVDLGDGVSWTVNGTDIPEDADFVDIDLGVTMGSDGIPVDVVNAITGEHGSVQMTLAHDGAFGFTMTLTAPLGTENAGLWANLYYFNESTNKMTFETAAPIGDDGSVSLPLSHASQYAIVIDNHNHGVVTLPFTDVADSDWFYDPVCYVYSQGLMTGTSENTFEPNTPLSRAMLVAVLHRLEGSPQASGGDFSDVADGDWYARAVNWAASVGVVNGFDDGNFSPNTAITREQLAAILRNYAAYKGLDVSARATLDTYNDATAISSWANDVMSWAVAEGLLTGVTNDQLQPQGNATRAQVAAILQRFLSE